MGGIKGGKESVASVPCCLFVCLFVFCLFVCLFVCLFLFIRLHVYERHIIFLYSKVLCGDG